MKIIRNQLLEMHNLLSVRSKIHQEKVNVLVENMLSYVNANNLMCSDEMIIITHSALGNEIDIEVMVPCNTDIINDSEYTFKPLLRISNALRCKHEGDPQLLNNTYRELDTYIKTNGLIPVTPAVNISKIKNTVKNQGTDIYIAVNDSII